MLEKMLQSKKGEIKNVQIEGDSIRELNLSVAIHNYEKTINELKISLSEVSKIIEYIKTRQDKLEEYRRNVYSKLLEEIQ